MQKLVKLVKMKIFKFMSRVRTKRYVDKLQAMVDGLNARHMPAIGTTPASVNVRNEIQIFHRRYDHIFRHQDQTPAFQVRDYCRLRLQKLEQSTSPTRKTLIIKFIEFELLERLHQYSCTSWRI